jgi:hypothetical protein
MRRCARFAKRPPLHKERLSLGADRANQNGVAAKGPCDTRPFSGEWLQRLGVALQGIRGVSTHQREGGAAMYANSNAHGRRALQSGRVLRATAGTSHHAVEDLLRGSRFL